jgi:AcrR family transcriptional regulator
MKLSSVPEVKSKRVMQGQATRGRILAAARELFGTRGFAATSTEEIVRAAGVTRGALYHHFSDKQDLFRAVFEAAEQEVAERMFRAVSSARDLREAAVVAWEAVLDTALDRTLTRIRVVEAPAALPWAVWHDIQAGLAIRNIENLVQTLMEHGLMDVPRAQPLAVLLMGAASEATAVIGNSPSPETARAEIGEAARWLTERLLTPHTSGER